MLRVLPALGKLVLQKVTYILPVWLDSHLFSVYTQITTTWFFARQVLTWVAKQATQLFNFACFTVAWKNLEIC